MKKNDFYYELPKNLIAQHPPEKRGDSRMLFLDGDTGGIKHMQFSELPVLLHKGDCLVINNTKVIPARLLGNCKDRKTKVEFLLLKRLEKDIWEVIVRPGNKVRTGQEVVFIPDMLEAKVLSVKEDGNRIVEFFYPGIWEEVLDIAGQMPLPPYITEKLEDKSRYQTIYAKEEGSAAAPTAGLHFTAGLFEKIIETGVVVAEVTLHVGLGTFRPVKVQEITDHVMHSEYFEVSQDASDKINKAVKEGGRIIAAGTTSCRVLESVMSLHGQICPCSGDTDIFIYPGYDFKIVDALITNFHLPESTLIMLVSAFAGSDNIRKAYEEAICREYRFFSFGDAMFLTKRKTIEDKTRRN
ncbi:MAG: tRNA preQ1(34) S-adenosylmethionine ribosyltransferase-isomerase QueA [Saccharofermentanales bacterium]